MPCRPRTWPPCSCSCSAPDRGAARRSTWTGKYVQLRYGRATLRDVKSRAEDVKDRIVDLEPRAVAALRSLAADGPAAGPVFLRADGQRWHADTRISGAQINRAFQLAAAQAGIDRRVFLHMVRHSWASWHYAVHRNLKKLKDDGAWESLDMADRYSHLAPKGMMPEILTFWGSDADRANDESS